MVINPAEYSKDTELIKDFVMLLYTVDGLEELAGNMKSIKASVTSTDDELKYKMTGRITSSLINALNAIEDDLNDTAVFLEADQFTIENMLSEYKRLEEALEMNAG